MDRCPNCGSTVRVGAKFCTTCGFRLPIPATPQEPPTPTRSPFDITPTAHSWPTFPPAPAAAATPDDTARTEPAAGGVDQAAPAAKPNDSAAPFSGWPSYGSGVGARANWPGTAPAHVSDSGVTADANASGQTDPSVDMAAQHAPSWQERAAATTGDAGSGVIDLQALARAEEPEFDEVASYFDRGANPIEGSNAAAPGETGDGATSGSAATGGGFPAGGQAAASGESGTAESVDRYLERMNAGAATESVADYLARVGEPDQDPQAPGDGSAAGEVDTLVSGDQAADALISATSDSDADETAAAAGDALAGDAQDEEHEAPAARTDESVADAGPAPADTDAEFANIFDRIFESEDAAMAAAEPETADTGETDSSSQTATALTADADRAESTTEGAPAEGEHAPVVEATATADTDSELASAEEPPAETASAGETVVAGESAATPTGAVEGDPGARAAALVAELQELLPRLTAAAGAPAVDVAAIADALAEQRGGTIESTELKGLRATVATAQARPRDVDVVLELAAKSATIADLLAAHDRFARAIDEAVAALRGETPPAPKPRW